MKKGTPRTTCHARSATVRAVKKTVRTAAGTSVASYREELGDTQMAGEIQGEGNVMTLWTLISDSILSIHVKLCKGVNVSYAAYWLTSSRCADIYVDDTDTYADHDGPEHPTTQFDLDEEDIDPADDPATEVIQNLQHSAQAWISLVKTVDGRMAFHKCNWQILSWLAEDGDMMPRERNTINGDIHVTDHRGQ